MRAAAGLLVCFAGVVFLAGVVLAAAPHPLAVAATALICARWLFALALAGRRMWGEWRGPRPVPPGGDPLEARRPAESVR